MTAETVISFIIMQVCMAPIVILGIVQYRSENPVGFWAGKKPPQKEQITDVKAYNRKHGLMWILYGTGFVVCFACGLPFGGEIAAVLCMAEVMGGIVAMAAYHEKLERMYRRDRGALR